MIKIRKVKTLIALVCRVLSDTVYGKHLSHRNLIVLWYALVCMYAEIFAVSIYGGNAFSSSLSVHLIDHHPNHNVSIRYIG